MDGGHGSKPRKPRKPQPDHRRLLSCLPSRKEVTKVFQLSLKWQIRDNGILHNQAHSNALRRSN